MNSQTHQQETVYQRLRSLEQQRYQALVDQDLGRYAELCHSELVFLHTTGEQETLDSFISKNSQGHFRYRSAQHPIDSITLIGDTAVILGDLYAELVAGEQVIHLKNRVIATWIRNNADEWKLLAHAAAPFTPALVTPDLRSTQDEENA